MLARAAASFASGLTVVYLSGFNVQLSVLGTTTFVSLVLVGVTVLISSIGPLRHA